MNPLFRALIPAEVTYPSTLPLEAGTAVHGPLYDGERVIFAEWSWYHALWYKKSD